MSTWVVRLWCSAGRARLEVPATITVQDVQQLASERFNIPTSQITLCLDPDGRQVLRGSDKKLVDFGLKTGVTLFVGTGDSRARMEGADLVTSEVVKVGQAEATVIATKTPPASTPANSGQEPRFKSFDAFLKERDFCVVDLPLNLSYKPTVLELGKLNKLPPSVTLKHQVFRHSDHLEFMNVEEINNFVRYWRSSLEMMQQRCGFLYGYYVEDKHYPMGMRAVIEAIYEPLQQSCFDSVTPLDDPMFVVVDQIAETLGLERLGFIFTSLPRPQLLSSDEVLAVAKLQLNHMRSSHYTGYTHSTFVTCSISLDESGEPIPNAMMVSDMGMALVRDGLFGPSPDPTHLKLRASTPGEVFPQVLEGGKVTTSFDCDWLVVRLNDSAPKKVNSRFRFSSFPRENRPGVHQQPADIAKHLKSVPPSTPAAQRCSDFHLLVYIATLFDAATALAVAKAVAGKQPVESSLEEVFLSLG